ncbi:MAG TPA: hypothetical protein VH302_04430 [Bryobacteraceae bacterium]|nr:hypothetical protein [Bryobacteraceae bacterium]
MRGSKQLQRSPFWTLVGHFVNRLLAGEEDNESGFSFGLGAILAMLASPGAFATIFLLDKYSTLIQWFRHQHVDAYKISVSDEYFFIVLSMTITGLVMLLRWNRLFPDRRDFANLAVLPIPIRNIFIANFLALFGLASLFAVDVNGFSAFFFPFLVTISDGQGGSFAKLWLMLRSHAATVFLASLFSFFAVFGIVGLLLLVVPRRWFPAASLAVRILLVVTLLAEFFANILLHLLGGRIGSDAAFAQLLPSFWFLGIYREMAHLGGPNTVVLADRALFATTAAVFISIGAYALCYRQRFVRLAESLDQLGGSRHVRRVPLPSALIRLLFPSSFDRACGSFLVKGLLRSERHVMFLGGYLGLGFIMTAETALDAFGSPHANASLNPYVLAIPLMIAFFVISGIRLVLNTPAALNANWVFRSILDQSVSNGHSSANPRRPVRVVMLLCTIPWQIAVVLPLTQAQYGWRIAVIHTVVVMTVSITLIEGSLARFRKIPFTCSNLPDIRSLIMHILAAVLTVIIGVPTLAGIEAGIIEHPERTPFGVLLLGIAWYWIYRQRAENAYARESIVFEDVAAPDFELLKLV